MISNAFDKGRRLFTATSLLTVLAGVMHTFGFSRPPMPGFDAAVQLMQNTTVEMGFGMSPSLWDLHTGLGYTMSIALFLMGGLGLTFAATTEMPSKILSRTAAVMAIGSGAMTALYYITKIPPPLLSMGVLTLMWGLSMRTTRLA